MKCELQEYMNKSRIPLFLRKRNGIIYFQLQVEIAREDRLCAGTYCEYDKIEALKSMHDIGILTLSLLDRFHEIADLTIQEFNKLTGLTVEEYQPRKSEQILKFMNAKDVKDLNRNYEECGIDYEIATNKYDFHLSWVYREGNRYWNDSSESTGDPNVQTFDEPLTFTESTPPEEIGRMVIEALNRSKTMAVVMSGDYCPPKTIELLCGKSVSISAPKDKHFIDAQDYNVGEIYQGYSYLPTRDSEAVAEFYLGIGAELDCDLNRDNIQCAWQNFNGKADFFEVREVLYGIFTMRAEMKNKNVHKVSYFVKVDEFEILECTMEVKQPNRRKALDMKLLGLFEGFVLGCEVKS